jgi:hypothetical protein
MRILPRLLLSLSVLLIGTLVVAAARAAEAGPEAKIVKIISRSGAPTLVVNGVSETAREQMAVPLNAVIQTTNQEVYLEVSTGVVATIKPNSQVAIATLNATDSVLELRQGRLVTQIDKNRPNKKSYGVKVGNGVAAARGTSFTVTNDATGFSITTTADGVEFTTAAGRVTIQAGQYTFTPAGATEPGPTVPLATAASDPAVAAILREAVSTAATVVQNNLGSISAEAATSIVTQVVAVAVAALPAEATTFTSTAVAAVTAPTSATGASAEAAATAAGSITAAAVAAAPTQAAQIAAAAAAAAPAQAGVITAAAQQVAPESKEAIAEQVAASTGQSTTTVQNNADSSTAQATKAVETSKTETSNVVAPPATSSTTTHTPTQTETQETTPKSETDPTLNVSPAI